MKLDDKLRWWENRREEILGVVKECCPLLIWDDESINDIFFGTLLIEGVSKIFHKVSTNPHKRVIEKVFKLGGGFKCQMKSHFDLIKNSLNTKQPVMAMSVLDTGRDVELVIKTNFPVPERGKVSRHNKKCWEEHNFLKIRITANTFFHSFRYIGKEFRGLYLVPNSYGQDSTSLEQLQEILKKFLPYTTDNTPIIVLNRQVGFELDPQDKCPDLEKTREKIEELKNFFPHIEIWLDPEELIFTHTGALFAKVVKVAERYGNKYTEVDLNAHVFHTLENMLPQSYGINFSSRQESQGYHLNLFPSRIPENLFIPPIPCYSEVKKGDIVMFPNTGMLPGYLSYSGCVDKYGISYHYLCARRICQVNL